MWHAPVFPALQRWEEEEDDEVIRDYTLSLRPTRATQDSLLKQDKIKKVLSQSLAAKFLLPVRHSFSIGLCRGGVIKPSLLVPLAWIGLSVWIPALQTPWSVAVLLMACALPAFIDTA